LQQTNTNSTLASQEMKTFTLILLVALLGLSMIGDADALRGGGGRGGGFGRGGFGRGFGFGRGWGWGGWGGFGFPWWAYGGWGGLGFGGLGFRGRRDAATETPKVICELNSIKDQNATLHCKTSTKTFTCTGLSNLNPAWEIKLKDLALIPVDHTVPFPEWDIKILSMDEKTHQLNNFTTTIEGHELTLSMVADESNQVPGYLFKEPCWTDFINAVKDAKFEEFEFNINDE